MEKKRTNLPPTYQVEHLTKQWVMRFSAKQFAEIERLADEHDMYLARFIRYAIDQYCRGYREQQHERYVGSEPPTSPEGLAV